MSKITCLLKKAFTSITIMVNPHDSHMSMNLRIPTLYARNKSNKVKIGNRVNGNDIIGHVGSTGKSTGPHVHYEAWKNGRTVNLQNFISRKS